jgi:predicted dehydrogenase
VRVLIAGLGAIGQRHARNLRLVYGADLELHAFRQRRLPHVVTDRLQRDDSRDVERELDVRVFTDLDEALAARPDAVFVCTPSSLHLDVAQRAADAGCHLFIEKPVSHTLDGLARLRDTAASKHLVVLVGCQWRYHPCVRWLRDALRAQRFGTIEQVAFDYAEYLPDWHPYEDYRTSYAARADLGGGVVLTQIHDFDLAWWLFGPFTRVAGTGGHLSSLEIDVEDTVDAVLDRRSGAPVNVRQTFAARPRRRTITVTGDRDGATVDLLEGRVATESAPWPAIQLAPDPRHEMFLDEVRNFRASLEGTARPEVPLEDGIAVLRLALAVKDVLRTGQPVDIR